MIPSLPDFGKWLKAIFENSVTFGRTGQKLSHSKRTQRKKPGKNPRALEVTGRFELPNEGFADPCLTTWLCHRVSEKHYTIRRQLLSRENTDFLPPVSAGQNEAARPNGRDQPYHTTVKSEMQEKVSELGRFLRNSPYCPEKRRKYPRFAALTPPLAGCTIGTYFL